jgi:hypothetical protein
MHRRGRIVLVLLVALAAGAAGVYALMHRKGDPGARPFEAQRTFFISQILYSHQRNTGIAGRRKADAAHDLITKGTPFADVANAQTDEESERGTGGFASAVQVFLERPTALHGAIQMLAEGELAPPLFSDLGWHVLYRHPYEEGRGLDRKIYVPAWAFRVTWRELEGGGDRSKEEAREVAARAVRDLRAGTLTFAQARAQFGTPGQERADGWWGRIDRRVGWAKLYDALKVVPEGAYVDPIEASDGWVVMRRGANFRSVVRQILVQHLQSQTGGLNPHHLTRAQAQERAEAALAKARGDLSLWPDLVRTYSDDVAPIIDDQGSFGCIAPGQLPLELAPLEDAIAATPPGQVHPRVVETSLGFHVLYRVD